MVKGRRLKQRIFDLVPEFLQDIYLKVERLSRRPSSYLHLVYVAKFLYKMFVVYNNM